MERIYTPEEVAKILQLHLETVYKFHRQKKLPSFKVGTSVRFRESDLEDFINDQIRTATDDDNVIDFRQAKEASQ